MMENITLTERLNELNSIEDDEAFCTAEYDTAHDYCLAHNFELNADDMGELKARCLMESFECWKERSDGGEE